MGFGTAVLRAAIRRYLTGLARRLLPVVPPTVPHGLTERLYVSVASYPPRFATLDLTLKCLLSQSVAPDGVLLWIPPGTEGSLPAAVTTLRRAGLTIREAPQDCGPFNKIVHTLPRYPDATIVTADDDVSYPRDWLEGLVRAHAANPRAVLAYRAHRIAWNADGTIAPYDTWTPAGEGDDHVLATGVGGILYPPHSLHADTTDAAVFMKLCPTADDLWLCWMAYRNGTPVRKIAGYRRPTTWTGSQTVALNQTNVIGGQNDVVVRALVEEFGDLPPVSRQT